MVLTTVPTRIRAQLAVVLEEARAEDSGLVPAWEAHSDTCSAVVPIQVRARDGGRLDVSVCARAGALFVSCVIKTVKDRNSILYGYFALVILTILNTSIHAVFCNNVHV